MGLALHDVEAHAIQFCPTERLYDFGIRSKLIQGRSAILFQYLNEYGNKMDIYQARMIGEAPKDVPPKGMTAEQFAKMQKEAFPKYLAGRGKFDLYFPLIPQPWMDIEHVFITEGIPKAIRACRAGMPCTSIQGKDMFIIKNTNLFVPGLERLVNSPKLKRITYIADSDAHTKFDIKNSAIRLVGLLNGRRKANDFADYCILPDLPEFEKTGLDDFINLQGLKPFWDNFKNWLEKWEGGRYSDLMEILNKKLCWITGTTNYVDRIRRKVINAASASLLIAPDLSQAGSLVNPYAGYQIGNGKATLAVTFDRDPFKTAAQSVDFWPGMPEWAEEDTVYNLWRDASPIEEDGDIEPFLNLLKVALPSSLEQTLLLQLLAHRIENPQDKSPLMVFMSGAEGTGKTCLATALFAALTTNRDYTYIGSLNLGYSHEDNHIFKQAVCMEEPSQSGMTSRDMEATLKLIGDSDYLPVNPKGVQAYRVRNRMLFWINSNQHFLPVSGEARRWLILSSSAYGNPVQTKACWDWMKATPNFGGRLRKYIKSRYPEVDVYSLRQAATNLDSKRKIVSENRAPALIEFELFIDEIPDVLKELKVIPTRLMFQMSPYNEPGRKDRQSITRILSMDYPLVRVGDSKDGKVNVSDGINSSFRSIVKGLDLHMFPPDLKELYKKWENHPYLKRKF
jgi:hypothetical protein